MKTKTITEIKAARIIREGTSPKTGTEMAVLRFTDGTEGALPREFVRSYSVAQGKESREVLESEGFVRDGGAVAGLFSGTFYSHPDGRIASVEGSEMGRIVRKEAK